MPITHNIKSPVTLAAADITEAEIANNAVTENKIANSAVTDNKVNFTSSIAVGNSTVNTSITNQSINTYAPITNKNLIINGGMHVWQRSTNTAVNTNIFTYPSADRWKIYNFSGSNWTSSQSTDVPSDQGFFYSQKWDCTSANSSPSNLSLRTVLEGQDLQHLNYNSSNAKSITLSFWVKSNVTGTYCVMIQRYNNSGTILGMISKSYTIDVADTWEKKSITYPGHTSGGAMADGKNKGFNVQWWMTAPSFNQSGTLQTTWGSDVAANKAVGQVNLASSTSNEWYITGVQLEIGDQATSFEFEPFQTTINKCYRYFYYVNSRTLGVTRNSADLYNSRIDHPVTMRASPSLYSGSFTAHTGSNGTVSISASRFVGSDGTQSMNILNADNNWTSGAWIAFTGGLSAEL